MPNFLFLASPDVFDHMIQLTNKWTVIPTPRPDAVMQLLCFHHAGGGAFAFRDMSTAIHPAVELVAVQLPGRENRCSEPREVNANNIIDQLAPHLRKILRADYVIFGHSLGACLGFLLAQRAQDGDMEKPKHLFLSAAAPNLSRSKTHAADANKMTRQELLADLRRHGGTPDELLGNDAYLTLLLPLLRADYLIYDSIDWSDVNPLGIPITATYGSRDPDVTYDDMATWSSASIYPVEIHSLDGGHFYSDTGQAGMLRLLNSVLTSEIRQLGRNS